jgi:hypothetical protein
MGPRRDRPHRPGDRGRPTLSRRGASKTEWLTETDVATAYHRRFRAVADREQLDCLPLSVGVVTQLDTHRASLEGATAPRSSRPAASTQVHQVPRWASHGRSARSSDQAAPAAPGGTGEGADRGRYRLGGQGVRLRFPDRRPSQPYTDFHIWKRLLRDVGVRDGRLHGARHTAATVLLILGIPDVVIDSIMGWEPGERPACAPATCM